MATMTSILDSLDGLASLPQTVLRVTTMLSGGKSSADEVEKVARTDEAISLAILRCANSSAFGRQGAAFTLKQSIARLGNSNLLAIVLRQKTSAMFENSGSAYGLERGALWRSATGGALTAQTIAKNANFKEPDLAYLCALLRDVGKLAFDAHFGKQYAAMVVPHINEDRTFLEAERAAFGFDHAQLGAALALRWKLPERIANSIAFHHNPPATAPDHDTLFDIVHAADVVCLWAGLAIGCDGMQYSLAQHVRDGLAIDRPTAENLIASTWDSLRATESLMGNPTQQRASA